MNSSENIFYLKHSEAINLLIDSFLFNYFIILLPVVRLRLSGVYRVEKCLEKKGVAG